VGKEDEVKKILVVDDEKAIRDLISDRLTQKRLWRGYRKQRKRGARCEQV